MRIRRIAPPLVPIKEPDMVDERILGLKIDVDTKRGMGKGVPSLLSTLASFSLRATFFLSFGPDNSGKAVSRLLRHPGFLLKMLRTNAPRLYGMKTALYGTLLPAPMIASAHPELCRQIEAQGHEVELHGWDHRTWQDCLPKKEPEWIQGWLDQAIAAYKAALGHSPRAFGAPGWVLTEEAIRVLNKYQWAYISSTRAAVPFIFSGTKLLEIPSDLPCLEEAGGAKGVGRILEELSKGGIHVLPVHAEAEGGIWGKAFAELLRGAMELGYRIVPLSDVAGKFSSRNCSTRPLKTAALPGRAFPCAV
jgi:undecaprenyl phosphate-alpha-L-ara4FN deformylase